jgi:hypothetical protein
VRERVSYSLTSYVRASLPACLSPLPVDLKQDSLRTVLVWGITEPISELVTNQCYPCSAFSLFPMLFSLPSTPQERVARAAPPPLEHVP